MGGRAREQDPIPHSRPTLVPGLEEAALAVIRSGQHAGGEVRRRFEQELCARVGVAHGLAVQSGFAALHLGLLALGVERGDRVLVPSWVCVSLLHALAASGARPLVADVDPATGNLTPETARAALDAADPEPGPADGPDVGPGEGYVRCAIVPHLFGTPAPLARWDLDLPVLEDCAMALGAVHAGRPVGGHGRLAIFSFYATKMLSTGQGGMVVTDDAELAAGSRERTRYDNLERWSPGYNYRLSDLAAALGRVQLRVLDGFLERRRELAGRYRAALAGTELELLGASSPSPVGGAADDRPGHFRCVVLAADRGHRERLREALAAAGIESKPPVFRPLHRYLEQPAERFPATERLQERALSVPLYPSLTDAEQERVLKVLRGVSA